MTEDQQGGTTPEPEAIAPDDQVSEQSVAAVAVADEPATMTEAAEGSPSTEEPAAEGSPSTEEPAAEGSPSTEEPAAEGSPSTEEPAATDESSVLSADDTAHAPAASDEDDEPEPARVLGPEPTTMEELLAEQDSDIKSFKHGDVVEGQVVRIDKDEILVDIGAKSEGVVSNRELFGRHGEGQPVLAIGDTVLVYVLQPESPEGHVVLSLRRAGLERKWRAMQEQLDGGVIIEAPVIDHNKGGLIVDCGIRGFVPISQIVDFPRRPQNDQPRDAAQEIAEKLMPFVGRKLRLKILEVNRKANRLILSEKVALYEERREKRDELFSSLQVGQKVTGTVRSIAPFGVFIDLGGIDGLVHKSELSWNKVNNPESGYQVGEEVEAEVIDINHERGRISLSIRRLQPDPWHSTVADFNVGDIIDGTVTKLVNFGAFVRVRDGLEGLIHISELSHQRVAHPGDVVHEGQQLKLKIISLDSERHRLGLSLKQAEEPPARPAPEPSAPRTERRPRPERSYSMSDAVQEPEGGIDNTLASAFAQVRQQLAEAEGGDVTPTQETAEPVDPNDALESAAAEEIVEAVSVDEQTLETTVAEAIDIVEAVSVDEAGLEGAAAEAIEAIVDNVAADESAVESAAAEEIEQLVDAADANEANEAPAPAVLVEVVQEVAVIESLEEEAAEGLIATIVQEVAVIESLEEEAAAEEIESIAADVAAEEYVEEAVTADAIAEEGIAADEVATVAEIVEETAEAETKGA